MDCTDVSQEWVNKLSSGSVYMNSNTLRLHNVKFQIQVNVIFEGWVSLADLG